MVVFADEEWRLEMLQMGLKFLGTGTESRSKGVGTMEGGITPLLLGQICATFSATSTHLCECSYAPEHDVCVLAEIWDENAY